MDSPGREERAARRQTRPGQRREGAINVPAAEEAGIGHRAAGSSYSVRQHPAAPGHVVKNGETGAAGAAGVAPKRKFGHRRAPARPGLVADGAWGGLGLGVGGNRGADGQAGQAEGGKASKAAATYPWGGGPWL